MIYETWRIVRIARSVAKVDPLMGYELERCAVGVINPGAKKFEQNLDSTIAVLKSLEVELKKALEELETEDAKEFAKFFETQTEAEEEELRRMLRKVSSTAGFKDFFKKIFKPKEIEEEWEGMEPSYTLDDATIDEILEGRREWADPEHYIEQEAQENVEFFSGVESVLERMEEARKKPSRGLIESIMKTVQNLIRKGQNLAKGIRQHLIEPAPKIEITEEGMKEEKPAAKGKLTPEKLENTVEHYADMLKEALGDESKTVKYLKELFQAVGPMIEEERASLAAVKKNLVPILVRVAYTHPKTRPVLLPYLKRVTTA